MQVPLFVVSILSHTTTYGQTCRPSAVRVYACVFVRLAIHWNSAAKWQCCGIMAGGVCTMLDQYQRPADPAKCPCYQCFWRWVQWCPKCPAGPDKHPRYRVQWDPKCPAGPVKCPCQWVRWSPRRPCRWVWWGAKCLCYWVQCGECWWQALSAFHDWRSFSRRRMSAAVSDSGRQQTRYKVSFTHMHACTHMHTLVYDAVFHSTVSGHFSSVDK